MNHDVKVVGIPLLLVELLDVKFADELLVELVLDEFLLSYLFLMILLFSFVTELIAELLLLKVSSRKLLLLMMSLLKTALADDKLVVYAFSQCCR